METSGHCVHDMTAEVNTMPIHMGSIICRAPRKMQKWGPPCSNDRGQVPESRFSLCPAVSLSTWQGVFICYLMWQSFGHRNPAAWASVQQLGRVRSSGISPPTGLHAGPRSTATSTQGGTCTGFLDGAGWEASPYTVTLHDVDNCYQCPVLRRRPRASPCRD